MKVKYNCSECMAEHTIEIYRPNEYISIKCTQCHNWLSIIFIGHLVVEKVKAK